jgi:hypothetical protein
MDLSKHPDLIEELTRPDQGDRAAAMEELRRRAAIATKKPEAPAATGFCFNCDARLHHQHQRWCDVACRDDWQKAQPQ